MSLGFGGLCSIQLSYGRRKKMGDSSTSLKVVLGCSEKSIETHLPVLKITCERWCQWATTSVKPVTVRIFYILISQFIYDGEAVVDIR